MTGDCSRRTDHLGSRWKEQGHIYCTDCGKLSQTKAIPEKTAGSKRRMVSVLAERSEEGGRVRGRKRKLREEDKGRSGQAKKKRGGLYFRQYDYNPAFEAKYTEVYPLGQGGCASVFAGYRKIDAFPVAIKHIPKNKVVCKPVRVNGKLHPAEVAITKTLTAETEGSMETSAPVRLLDWYDLSHELILVLERPVPAHDLLDHIVIRGSFLQEDEAKTILKQLVDAAIGLARSHIFHRDIKPENILIETGSCVPRVRLIDFGLSCIVKDSSFYSTFRGTPDHVTPEWCRFNACSPGPTTVWQVGIVLYEMMHGVRFNTLRFLKDGQEISKDLSKHCKDFLKGCLHWDPVQRLTLEQLKLHSWLQ